MADEIQYTRKSHFCSDGVLHATINHHRFHLRTSPSGEHLLWIDGQQPPYILDRTAAEFVTHLIRGMWLYQQGDGDESEKVVKYVLDKMCRKYCRRISFGNRVTRERIGADLDRIFGILMSIANGACPNELGIEGKSINYASWSASARMDLAITYRCNLQCGKCYLGNEVGPELTAEQWTEVFGVLWKLGIPQVVFTGGEPTMREDLVHLVRQAEEFVTGLVTNGTMLSGLAGDLVAASLDYVQVTVESSTPEIHDSMTGVSGSHGLTVDGIRKALSSGLDVVTNTTLVKQNVSEFVKTIRWLHDDLGVRNIACNTLICSGRGTEYRDQFGVKDEDLRSILEEACSVAAEIGANLQWYSPTCYYQLNPLELGLGVKQCSAAAHNMTVQPDGSVLPCQSWPTSVGNILTDDWASIWKHPVCGSLRNHAAAPPECKACGYKEHCGGGCPLDKSSRLAQKEAQR